MSLTKFDFLQFQKWPKINFWTGKKFKTARNAISREKNCLFWFHEFFCQDFFKFSGPLWCGLLSTLIYDLIRITMEHNGMKVFLSKEMMLYRIRNNQFISGAPLILTKKILLCIKSRDICYWSMTFFSHVQIHPTSDGGTLFLKKIAEL